MLVLLLDHTDNVVHGAFIADAKSINQDYSMIRFCAAQYSLAMRC